MKVNLDLIKALKPCNDRLSNYEKHHASYKGNLTGFFKLEHITHADKLWVSFRLMPKEQAVECAARFAESVLHIYENAYPGDPRPRKAIEAARSGKGAARAAAANDAAYAANAAAANAAAAYDAAAYHAATAAYHAARDAAANAASYAAAAARDAGNSEPEQLATILAVVKEDEKE